MCSVILQKYIKYGAMVNSSIALCVNTRNVGQRCKYARIHNVYFDIDVCVKSIIMFSG